MRSVNLQSKQPVSSNSPPAAFSSISPTCELLPMELEGVSAAHKSSSHGILESQSESNLPTPYATAPSSPTRSSSTPFNSTPCFYSYPSSPVAELEPSAAAKNSSNEEQPKIQQQQQQQTMSLDEELFSNGQLRPLKLPPRLQGGKNPSPRVPSPMRSRGATSCYTFYSQSFKNKDFDPFAAALEEIRKEDAWLEQTPPRRQQLHRRTESHDNDKDMDPAELSGQVRRVPKGQCTPKVMHSPFAGPVTVGGGHSSKAVRGWDSLVSLSKRKMIRDRQIQAAFEDSWVSAPDKERDHQATIGRPEDESTSPIIGALHQAQYKVEDGVEHKRVQMKALIKYKPDKLFLCFGLDSRGKKRMQKEERF